METPDHDWIEAEPQRWKFSLGWPLMLFIGWLVFDLTADAALTAVIACAKFGWNDWLTARWLRKTDPVRARAAACAWFFRASAVWKVALAATVGMFLLILVEIAVLGRKAPGREWTFVTCEAFLGFLLAGLLTSVASFFAWRGGQRVWVNRRLHLLRRHEIWPPLGVGRRNGVPALVTTAVLTWLAPVGLFLLFAALAPVPQKQPQQGEGWIAIVTIGGIVLSAVFVLTLREVVTQRIAARTARECRPEMNEIHGPWERLF